MGYLVNSKGFYLRESFPGGKKNSYALEFFVGISTQRGIM